MLDRLELLSLAPRLAWAARPIGRRAPRNTWAPDLPGARRISLPGRGEVSIRFVDGPPGAVPVLLLHGVTWSGDINYHALIRELSEHHPVITMDHRGHGFGLPVTGRFDIEDLADDAVAVLDALDIPVAIVGGFSLGALTSLQVGLRHPDRVHALVLSAGALVLRDWFVDRTVMRLALDGVAVLSHGRVGTSIPIRYFGLTRHTEEEFRSVWPWMRGEMLRNRPRDIAYALAAAGRHDVRKQAGALREVPSVVLVHGRDTLIPARLQRAMAAAIGAESVLFDADHDAPVARPAAYRDAMLVAIARADEMAWLSRRQAV
jgi:3-oxoadipate enol-lactonase